MDLLVFHEFLAGTMLSPLGALPWFHNHLKIWFLEGKGKKKEEKGMLLIQCKVLQKIITVEIFC